MNSGRKADLTGWWTRRRRTLPAGVEDVIAETLAAWRHLPAQRQQRLLEVAGRVWARTDWEAARGFEVTEAMAGCIVGHASLLAIGRHDRTFHSVRSVVVHPGTIMLEGERRAGPLQETVVSGPEPVAGHTDEHGPVFVNWRDLRQEREHPEWGRNVAFHEFAHKLDAENGPIDGTPALERALAQRWQSVCQAEFEALRRGRGTRLLDNYAATDPGEFFAVTTELFFTRPFALQLDRPDLYGVFSDYFGQDPATEWTGAD